MDTADAAPTPDITSSSATHISTGRGPLAPVAKLDATHLLGQLDTHAGVHLELLGPAPGGQVGAVYVGWPDGTEGVLTWVPDASAATEAHLRRTAEVLEIARGHGLPVPTYDLVARLPDAFALVQRRLSGRTPTTVDRALVDQLVAANERFAGLLAERIDVPTPELFLTHSATGFCVHESLQQYDARTRRLLACIHRIGAESPSRLAGDDVVHLDYHPGNVLVDADGHLNGIVDWDGTGRGDRHFAFVTLCFDLTWTGSEPGLSDRLDRLLYDAVEPRLLRAYDAHMSLRLVDWAIRHHGQAEIEHWLAVADERLGRYG